MENNTPNNIQDRSIAPKPKNKGVLAVAVIIIIVLAVIFIRIKNPSLDMTNMDATHKTPNSSATSTAAGGIEVNTTTSVLIFKEPTDPIAAQQHILSPGAGAKGISILNFRMESTKGPTLLKRITIAATGTIPVAAYIYEGNTLLKKATSTGEMIVFGDINLAFKSDEVRTLTVKADYGANTPSGSQSIAAIVSSDWERPNGSGFRSSFSWVGAAQTFTK